MERRETGRGGGRHRDDHLTNDPGHDFDPAWSPDGTKLAFMSQRTDNNEVFVINADGSGVSQLTNNPGETTSRPGRPTGPGSPS